jgi:branched-subunit amino acid ABC-type transport system permease component
VSEEKRGSNNQGGKQMTKTKIGPIRYMLRSCTSDITPVRLRLMFFINCLGTVIFGLLAVATVQQHEHAVKTLGFDAAPSVIAARQIKIGVEQMDTDLVTELLHLPGSREGLWMAEDFEKWRIVVCKQIVAAAKNITYGLAEQTPIENIEISLGQYEMQSQQAKDMHSLRLNRMTIDRYRDALQILEHRLLPNADALRKANADALESTYAQEESQAALSCGLVAVAGMLLIGSLLATQIYLARRFHRRLNLPLLIATFCLLFFVQKLYSTLMHNSSHLKIAKEDAYNSVIALLDARADSYEANAAMERWLLDRAHADEHEKTFLDKANSVACFAPGHDFTETIKRAEDQYAAEQKFNLSGFSGALADEFNNVRFEGEGQAALEALQDWSDYRAIDANMRQQEKLAAHEVALAVGLGYDPHAAKFSFAKFDDAVGRMLKINQYHFDKAIKEGMHDLKGLTVVSQLICLFVLFCIYAGFRPRLAEYVRPT